MRKPLLFFFAMIITGCIYPYDAPQPAQEWALVVDGDLLIGGEATIRLGRLNPLDGKGEADTPIWALCWVEDSEGNIYRPLDFHRSDSARIDLTKAPPDREYRLHVADDFTQHTYVSTWQSVQAAPVLDSISFSMTPDSLEIAVNVSLTGNSASPFVQVDWREQWQFHAPYMPKVRFVPNEGYFSGGPDYPRWCWKESRSREPSLAEMIGTGSDKIVNRTLLKHRRGDEQLQKRYAVDIIARVLSKEAYTYRQGVLQSSSVVGDLFSPTPSRMAGNIRCESDPNQMVLGFVDVAQVVRGRRILMDPASYSDSSVPFGRYPTLVDTLCFLTPSEIALEPQPYRGGNTSWRGWNFQFQVYHMIPFDYGRSSVEIDRKPGVFKEKDGMLWMPEYCADCTKMGGTTLRPDDWPEDSL